MKILTPISASSGLDVSSTGSDTIKLGSVNTENNDVAVDNLTVWANADFKNNVILGSSVVDNTLVNSKLTASSGLYVSGNLIVNGIEITTSSSLTEQQVSGALLAYAKSSDVSSSFATKAQITGALSNYLTITNASSTYATLIGVSSSYPRLSATNIFTANQIISGSLIATSGIISQNTLTTSGSLNVFNNIKFPATQIASSDVNTLDDYEEGTWSPTLLPGTYTYSLAAAEYFKIGRRVFLNGAVGISSTGSVTANSVNIGGLPFAITSNYNSLNIGYYSGFNTSSVITLPFGYPQGTSIRLHKQSSGSALSMSVTDLTNNATIYFSIDYYTSS